MRSLIVSSLSLIALAGCATQSSNPVPEPVPTACAQGWYESVEARLGTGDGQGHGPDLGSQEWFSVIEFRLGLRGVEGIPRAGSDQWCGFIEQKLGEKTATKGSGPSFDCSTLTSPSSAEQHLCSDAGLAQLDRQLADVYAEALERVRGRPGESRLKAEQRGWIKGRDECWQAEDQRACIADAYQRRTATLQARYRLVPFTGPVNYRCEADGSPLQARFFATQPPTAVVEYADSYSLMFAAPAASGARYEGRNESFWDHQGRAQIRWGQVSAECRLSD